MTTYWPSGLKLAWLAMPCGCRSGGATNSVTFAIGLALRHRNVPAPLAWLGLVSYSVYLLHPLVVNAYSHLSRHLNGASTGVQIVIAFGIAATVLLVSAAAYYCVEKPMQKAGRWVTARTSG